MRISDWSSDVCSSDLVGVQAFEYAYLYADQVWVEDAHELIGGVGRVGERAQYIENGAYGKFFAHGAHILHGAMVGGSEHEADAGALKAFSHLFGAEHDIRSEEHTSELQSLMRISYAVLWLKKKNTNSDPK